MDPYTSYNVLPLQETSMSSSITENLEKVRHRIRQYVEKYGRIEQSAQLIAVSKTHGPDKVREAADIGQQDFGENYLQEALDKIQALSDLPLTWHFIGPIQSNKTRPVAENFQWVHTVDRVKIAQRLNDQRPDTLPPLNILLQVNLSAEATKSGTSLQELPALADAVAAMPHLLLAGLMTIPAPEADFEKQRLVFRQLRDARDQLASSGYTSCQHLSMGMSSDFEAAIAEGATMVRIGTDIFGKREPIP
jgi:pyridoxal phosphate enzyme (YggS family)